nr:hypothetical protein [Tanacetum cinerariifolium]
DLKNVFNQERISVDIDKGIELVVDQEKDAEIEVRQADTQAEIYNIDLVHSSKEEKESFAKVDWNTAFDHVQAKDVQAKDVPAKGIQYIKRYRGFKKKPQSESEARKNMIAYLKNTEGFKMAFFKGKTYDQILLIFQARFDANMRFLFKSREEMEKEEEEIIKSINETPAQKAAKRRRLHEQAKEDENLKKQLEVVVDEDDDVFIEATPIGRKVPVVNYEIVMIKTNLVTLKTMFKKTDAQDVIWRSQQTEYGQALVKSWKLLTSCGVHIITFTTTMFALLVEKKYPLSRFTLEQLVNVARL